MKMKNCFIFLVIAAMLTACSGGESPQKSAGAFKAILITDVGGLGDKGFNDAGWAGCELAKKQLAEQGNDIEVQFIESEEQTDYVSNLNMASERADVVIALGFLISDAVIKVAAHNPDTKFIFIDGKIKGDNIASFDFRSNEAAFQAGILASYASKSGVVGVMPGMDIPPVLAFASGFRAGVITGGALQNKPVQNLSVTIGSFDDPVKAKSIALSLMDQKADVILQLAGNSGLGVIEAVKEAPGRAFVIGADIDQDDLAPGKILTSILKRMDLVVAQQISNAYNGTFKSGEYDVGLKEKAVSLTDMRHTRSMIPKEAFDVTAKAEKLISTGTLKVPRTYAELEKFDFDAALLKP